MRELGERDERITNVRIVDVEGKVLYSIDKKWVGEKLPKPLELDFSDPNLVSGPDKPDANAVTASVLFEHHYHILLPIKDRDKVWRGTIDISFPAAVIDKEISEIVKQNLQVLAATTMMAALLLFLGLRFFAHIRRVEPPPKKRIFLIVLVIIGVAQIVYSSFNIQHFKTSHVDIMQRNIGKSASALHEELERWLAGGIKIEPPRRMHPALFLS